MRVDDPLDRLPFGLGSVSFNRIVALCAAFASTGAAVFLVGLFVIEVLCTGAVGISWGYVTGLAIEITMLVIIAYMASQSRVVLRSQWSNGPPTPSPAEFRKASEIDFNP